MGGVDERFDVLTRRTDALRALAERPRTKPDLLDRLGVSRSTVDRAVRELQEAGLVTATDDGYVTSPTGRLALDRYDAFRAETADVFDAAPVVEDLPPEADVPVELVAGAETVLATESAPYRPAERFLRALRGADRYRAALPAVADARQVRTLHDRIVAGGATAELVVPPSVVDHLETDFGRRLATMADTDRFRVRRLPTAETGEAAAPDETAATAPDTEADTLPYGVALVESDGDTTAWLLAYRDDGGLGGVVANDDAEAVAWAQSRYESDRTASEPVTDRFHRPEESSDSLPAVLRRAGFVRLSPSFFADRSADPPAVAWRTGLGLPEVYAGYAVERTAPDGDASLATTVADTLREGDHCAVVGPPGIGKSTVCKRVACEWYADGDGPVLYRRGGDGAAPFESADELLATVRRLPGRPLLVVEDAVRPQAAAVAAVADELDATDAAVLVDARESEWRAALDDDRGRLLGEAVRTVRVPALTERDRQRLAKRVAATLGETVADLSSGPALDPTVDAGPDVPTDDAGSDVPTAEETPSVFLHRLVADSAPGTEADTAAASTALEASFDRLLDELDRADALDAGLTVNLLNIAGVAVSPSHVRAVAGDTADRALDALDGPVFVRTDGAVRTVHHAWSLRLLTRAADQRPAAAAAAVERGVTALADLAADPVERARLREGEGGSESDEWPATMAADPTGWLTSVTRQLFRTLRSLPALAPVFEHESHRVPVPERLPPATALDCRLDRAKAHTDARHAERATAALDRAADQLRAVDDRLDADTRGRYRAEVATARGTLARQRGDLSAAADRYQTALASAADVESLRQRGRALNGLGAVAGMRGDVETAVDRFEDALAASRAADDVVTQSNALRNLGNVAVLRGDHASAVGHYEESISLARRHGLFTSLAGRYVSLGEAYLQQTAYDDAASAYTQGLQVARRVGAPGPEANALGGLGELALARGDLDTADQRLDRAVELFEALDRPRWLANATQKRGVLARRRGDPSAALDRFRAARATAEAVDDARLHAEIDTDLGLAEVAAGNDERGADRLRQALREWDETGLEAPSGRAKRGLAAVAFDRGDVEAATRHVQTALDRFPADDHQRDIAEAHLLAGRIADARDESERAREHLSAAVETFRAVGADDRAAVASDLLAEACPDADGSATDRGQTAADGGDDA